MKTLLTIGLTIGLIMWGSLWALVSSGMGQQLYQGQPDDPDLPLNTPFPKELVMQTPLVPPTRPHKTQILLSANVRIDAVRYLIGQKLSAACASRQFNQIKQGRHFVKIPDESGKLYRLEAASIYDGNLYDPLNYGNKEILYLFENDRSSECRVYTIIYFSKTN